MKVSELIKLLETLDQDKRVVISGYEGGVDDVDNLNITRILLNANSEWYYGKHEEVFLEGPYDEEAYIIV
jgi:hypothetical protein